LLVWFTKCAAKDNLARGLDSIKPTVVANFDI